LGGISIRHSEPEDYGAVHLVYSSPNTTAQTLDLPHAPDRHWRENLAGERDDHVSLVACTRGEADEVVGHLGLSVYPQIRRRHSGHFGVAVRDDWQGRGVGTALVGAAIALYEKFGFGIEGTHRRFAFRDGGYVDAHVMARPG
jgi:L-phenylalanine/L-methionine N-acetyltransferase